jgi:hypothetical protein
MQAMLASSPVLRAACPQHGTALLDELAGLVGARMGVDPVADPRPHLVASVALCAVQTAADAWRAHHPEVPLSQLIGQLFELLGAGIDFPAAAYQR